MDGASNGEARDAGAIPDREALFREMADGAPVLLWRSGTDALCDFFNRPWLEFRGRSMEEEVGNGWFEDGVHPDDKAHRWETYVRAFEAREEFEVEYRLRRHDGEWRWILDRGIPRYGPGGEFAGYVGSCIDVTERHRAAETQRFLAEASDVLSSSLDYRETLTSVARLAVPTLADWCVVDVLADGGSLERLAVTHPDPEKVRLAYRLQERYPADPDAPRGMHRVLRTGEPETMAEIPRRMVEDAARDEEHRQILGELGLKSYMIVPLVARGRTLGAIGFVTAESGRTYGEADLDLARELARRAALAVDNARLYGEAQKEIAERRRAQEELRASRDQLDIILRGAADGITAQDPSGRLIYANEAAARLSGYPSASAFVEAPLEEVMSRFELLDAEGHPFPLERLPGRRVLRGEGHAEEVLRFRVLKTGEERWTVVEATPVFDEGGRVRLVVNVFRDVTEQRRAEQERARLAAIVESSEDAIIGKTLEGIITNWNRGAQKIYGYSPEEVVGRPITILAPPERSGEIPEILERIRRGEKVERTETVRVTRDGRRLDISLSVSPIRDSTGNVVGAATIARDITELKRAEQAMAEVREAERRRMARDLHDGVLQDLSYVVQEMELTRLNAEGTGLERELQEEVEAVRSAVRGLRAAVHDLRLADELDLPFPRLLESLVERNREMARGQQTGLDVKEGVPSGPLGERGAELLRVIQEALTNARRHSGARNVEVTVGVEGKELVAEVRDDGRGLGPDAVPGVGLRSMRERAAALGGELEVHGEAGEGTTVRLRVPMPERG